MKHIAQFNDFLADTVNLNKTRIDLLEGRIETISGFLRNSTYKPRIRRFTPQGSWAHKTIIKPPGDKDFDADLLVIVDEVEDWSPAKYVNELHAAFRLNKTYEDKVSRRTRCIMLDYAGDFHLDVVPVIQEIGQNGRRYFVCNRNDDRFEETAPEGYTTWLVGQNRGVGTNQLRKVSRLLKYLRDVKGTFSAKSVLLTTLVGMQVSAADQLYRNTWFPDLPTSLKTIIDRLDDFLQARALMPMIANPVLPGEDFNRHWDQEKYTNYRAKIHQYRGWIDDAYAEPDNDESIAKWRRVFGDEFAKGITIKEDARALAPLYAFADRWLAALRDHGRQVLSRFPTNQDHVAAPIWLVDNRLRVTVEAGQSTYKNGAIECGLTSGDFVPRNRWVKFAARCPTGIPDSFRVWWRVANSGGHAAREGQLRGGFGRSTSPGVRWESTKYRGVHWVEAFVVNRRTNQCVGKSEPFFVVIE